MKWKSKGDISWGILVGLLVAAPAAWVGILMGWIK